MILTDSGPLVAILDRDEDQHARCVHALGNLTRPMVTTWPALTEAMCLLGRTAGWRGQEGLWRLIRRGDLRLAAATGSTLERMFALMEQYRDLPMDLADASLVAVAEELDVDRIFTLDSDFLIYRLPHGKNFVLIP